MASKKKLQSNESALKIIAAGIVVVDGDDLQLFSWQKVIERLGGAGSDLSLHIEWGKDFTEDVLDWAETLTLQNEVGTMVHALRDGEKDVASARCVVEFETDRVRLYYEGEDGVEAGITTIHFEGGDILNPVLAEFLPFGAKTSVQAEAVWFSGSLSL
jgi:hypothetical protein